MEACHLILFELRTGKFFRTRTQGLDLLFVISRILQHGGYGIHAINGELHLTSLRGRKYI